MLCSIRADRDQILLAITEQEDQPDGTVVQAETTGFAGHALDIVPPRPRGEIDQAPPTATTDVKLDAVKDERAAGAGGNGLVEVELE